MITFFLTLIKLLFVLILLDRIIFSVNYYGFIVTMLVIVGIVVLGLGLYMLVNYLNTPGGGGGGYGRHD
jgi:hypothetical protein